MKVEIFSDKYECLRKMFEKTGNLLENDRYMVYLLDDINGLTWNVAQITLEDSDKIVIFKMKLEIKDKDPVIVMKRGE